MIEKKAYGKINIFLDVDSRRSDGYHNIKSIMQTVDWYDTVKVQKNSEQGIVVKCNNPNVPCDSSNIVYKVAKAFLDKIGIRCGITVEIEKNLPLAAGMAGGSSDGAATLEALNELFGFPLSLEELVLLTRNIGADIPFCLVGGTKLISGIGDIIEDVEGDFPDCYILCAKRDCDFVSTPAAYKKLDDIYGDFLKYSYHQELLKGVLTGIKENSIETVISSMYNVFEEISSETETKTEQIKYTMLQNGALGAMMSGSGPSVFGIYSNKQEAEAAGNVLLNMGIRARVCKPISKKGLN